MQTATQKKWIGAGRFDAVNSTYKHRIILDNGKELTGYSKALLSTESPDKTVLLEKMILRLINKGYVFGTTKNYNNRTIKLEFYLNGTFLGIADELLFVMYPDKYIFGKNPDYLANKRLFTTLNRLYTQAKNGEIITKSLVHKPKIVSNDTIFDISKYNFKNEQQLHEFVMKKLQDRHPEGQVMDFYYKYRAKHFEKRP